MTAITEVSDATFQAEVLGSEMPVLVDFWAPWCGPCRVMDPVLKELSSEYGGRLRIVKMDVDENPDTAARFDVLSMPTFLLFERGEVRKRLIGALPRRRLEGELQSWLNGAA
jgi:thioredoxin 1